MSKNTTNRQYLTETELNHAKDELRKKEYALGWYERQGMSASSFMTLITDINSLKSQIELGYK